MFDFNRPVLAIDSALGGCVTAVINPITGVATSRTLETKRDQAARLIPLVQETVGEAGLRFADLGLIVTTIGPGSFTGLRIGMSTARGLGLALSIPVQGVDMFSVMARSCAMDGSNHGYAVILETKREDYYFQMLSSDFVPLEDAFCGSAEMIASKVRGKNLILCGDACQRLNEDVSEPGLFIKIHDRFLIDPVILARLGLENFKAQGGVAQKPEPFYMRGADVSVSKKEQRVLKNYPSN